MLTIILYNVYHDDMKSALGPLPLLTRALLHNYVDYAVTNSNSAILKLTLIFELSIFFALETADKEGRLNIRTPIINLNLFRTEPLLITSNF